MKKLKYELFVTVNNKQEIFVVEDTPITIGTAANSDIIIADGEPPIKAIFQIEDEALVVKVFDLKYPIKINGKKYKTAKLKNSVFFKVGNIDVILSVEEIEVQAAVTEDSEDFIEEEFDGTMVDLNLSHLEEKVEPPVVQAMQEQEKPQVVAAKPEQPVELPSEQLPQSVVEQEQKPYFGVPLDLDYNDFFTFKTKFDDSSFQPLGFEAYSHPHLDFTDYIDTEDETEDVLPSPPIVDEKDGYSLHIVAMNNGTVLDENFYSLKLKRVYISDSFGEKNYFQVHDCGLDKAEVAFMKGNHVSVVKLPGFRMAKISGGKAYEVKETTLQVLPGEKIILTKGTTQIIVQLSKAVPRVKPQSYFDFDEDLLKSIAYAWVFALFVLINVVIIDDDDKKPKQVVIYKKIEVKKPEKKKVVKTLAPSDKPVVQEEKPKKAEKPQEKPQEKVVKKVEQKKPEVKKVAEKKKVKKVKETKVVSKQPAVKKAQKVAKKVVKASPKPKPKKAVKFNFASSLTSSLTSTSPAKLKQAQSATSLNVAAMDSSSKVTSSFDPKSIGVAKTKVARFAAGSASGNTKMLGTKGLSGKTRSNTAYIEAKTKVLGALDPNLIRKIMREYIPQFRHCYQKELLRNPSVAGVFDLGFKINKYGKGVDTRVKSNGKGFSSKGRTCIKRVVDLIKFPRPKGGGFVDVRQPMNFYTNQ